MMDFDTLYIGLQAAVAEGLVKESRGEEGLRLYCYTEKTVYERSWNPITLIARGLILDVDSRQVVARPFPKFFNYLERGEMDGWESGECEIFDKMDGSLGILYFWKGKWRVATKGSLNSDQAQWAQRWLQDGIGWKTIALDHGVTYLTEIIYPENRIVLDYNGAEGLWLLGGINVETGAELRYCDLFGLGFEVVQREGLGGGVEEWLEKAAKLIDKEGWVVKFASGKRIKIKCDDYKRIHRMVSGCTPLNVWKVARGQECLAKGEDLISPDLITMRRELPEEFWEDFDTIVSLIETRVGTYLANLDLWGRSVTDMTDKELGLWIADGRWCPAEIASMLFLWRKSGSSRELIKDPRARRKIYEMVKPTANRLEGYRSSSLMNRVTEGE